MIYLIIAFICAMVFFISLRVTQMLENKKELARSFKLQKRVTDMHSTDNNLTDASEDAEINAEALEKIRILEGAEKRHSLQDNIKYQSAYVYGKYPMRAFILLMVKTFFCIILFLYFVNIGKIFTLIGGIILTPIISIFLLKRLYQKRISLFLDQFVYSLDIIVRGTRTGLALNDCFKQIIKDSHEVVKEQYITINDDFKLGLSVEKAMERFMKRLPLQEVQYFCLSIMIQSKTGGNLSDILEGLAKILQNRKSLIVRIATLSSEAKSSAIIMSAMPVAFLGIVHLLSPEFVEVYFTTNIGKIVLLGCATWLGIGALVMRAMMNIHK